MSNSKKILKSLNHCINILCQNPSEHLVNPQRYFSRQRKISLEDVIRSVLSMQNKALSNELLEYFNFGSTVPTASAFIQQRAKIKVSAFEQILKSFTAANDKKLKTYRGYRLLAVDGSDIAIAPNPEDYDTFFVSGNNSKPYSLVHLNAMYDLVNFHSKKVEFVYQEIFARIIMYNFCELITSHVVIQNKSRKYCYKINFSKAVHICRNLFLDKLSPHNAETLIARFVTPIRPDRKFPRRLTTKATVSFTYRIA